MGSPRPEPKTADDFRREAVAALEMVATLRAEMTAQVEEMRPVVKAATAWRERVRRLDADGAGDDCAEMEALVAAVDAYQNPPTPGEDVRAGDVFEKAMRAEVPANVATRALRVLQPGVTNVRTFAAMTTCRDLLLPKGLGRVCAEAAIGVVSRRGLALKCGCTLTRWCSPWAVKARR